MPRIARTLPYHRKNFNRHWDQDRYGYFRDRIHSHAAIAQEALASPSVEDSTRIWRRLFGEAFGKGRAS